MATPLKFAGLLLLSTALVAPAALAQEVPAPADATTSDPQAADPAAAAGRSTAQDPEAAPDISVPGSDIIVITSGLPRKPGMSRDDLLKVNSGIVKDVTLKSVAKSPNAMIIVVSNPLDAMTYVAYKHSKFPANRVMGMAGILDSSRFRTFIAMELSVSVKDITAFVLGGHGDTMVPSTKYTTVAGIPVEDIIPKTKLDAIVERTAKGGGEIVALLKTGSAYYAPAASAVQMVESIVLDKKMILPCAVLSQGKYEGCDGLFVGLPSKLGEKGVEEVVKFKLSEGETEKLKKSAAAVKELCEAVDRLGF